MYFLIGVVSKAFLNVRFDNAASRPRFTHNKTKTIWSDQISHHSKALSLITFTFRWISQRFYKKQVIFGVRAEPEHCRLPQVQFHFVLVSLIPRVTSDWIEQLYRCKTFIFNSLKALSRQVLLVKVLLESSYIKRYLVTSSSKSNPMLLNGYKDHT